MDTREKIKFVIIRTIGNFLVLFAVFGVIATFGPSAVTEARYRIAGLRGVEYVVASESTLENEPSDQEVVDSPGFSSILTGEKTQVLVPKDTDFSIVIPKIGASAKVYPNVDPGQESEFLPVLKSGIAHAKGTVFPGMEGKVYLFAHSTDSWWNVGRYNAIFYLLKDLENGDEIYTFFEGQRYTYVVVDKKVLNPDDVGNLINAQTGPRELILQTCWPPGTTWQRLFIIAKPKSEVGFSSSKVKSQKSKA